MSKLFAPGILTAIAALLLCAALLSCGGSKNSVQPLQTPNIAGSWEFIAQSSSTGAMTAIDVALKEGSTLVNGFPVPNGQLTADSAQIAFVNVANVSQNVNATGFGGSCLPINLSNGIDPGIVTETSAPITFTFTENGYVFDVTGTLSGDGTQVLNGTYTAATGNACTDTGGTIIGSKVANLAGVYTGKMCPLPGTSCSSSSDFTDTVTTGSLTEGSGASATLSLLITGTDNLTFIMNGTITGNAFSVTGTFQGQPVTFYGYSEQVTHGSNIVSSLYLVNAANPSTTIALLGLKPTQ